VLKTFKHKGLKELFEKGVSRKVNAQQAAKCLRVMDALDASQIPEHMNIPGYRFHGLNTTPKSYAISVTGNYRITFEWDGIDATKVNLEDYH
jgi:toxin HigB-1